MLFPTAKFAAFFLLVLLGAYSLRKQHRAQKWFLLLASYAFYASFDPRYLALLLVSTASNHITGRQIHPLPNGAARKLWLTFAILINVVILGFFKYYNFFRESLEELALILGLQASLPLLIIVLPVGISFYTFQAIAYNVDVYRRESPPAQRLGDFALYLAFFPQLVTGPIVRPAFFLHQLQQPRRLQPDLTRAVSLILSGLFKKVFVASYLSLTFVGDVFPAPENYSSLELWTAMFAYTIQVYCDFSGYTDMAMGLAVLLGYEIPENFNGPYAATNIGEYWRRWHISFSTWLRDYIYFPLGGSKVSHLRTYLNLMITFLVGGFWHGADWRFILWGAMHGVGLAGYKASLDLRRALGMDVTRRGLFITRAMGWLLTITFVSLARIFFRSPDIETALQYLKRMFTDGSYVGSGIPAIVPALILIGFLLNFLGRGMFEVFSRVQNRLPLAFRILLWLLLGYALVLVHPGAMAPFIYFQF